MSKVIYSIGRTQRASQMVNAVCALLFAAFCFCFLSFFQLDYLSFIQHYYSDGRNVDHSQVFPVVITVLLTSLGCFLQGSLHLPIRLRSLHWIPSILCLALVCGLPIGRYTQGCQVVGLWVYLTIVLLFCALYYVGLYIQESRNENSSFFLVAWPNLAIMLLGFVFVGYAANTGDVLHRELRVERTIWEGRWREAVAYMDKQDHVTRSMTSPIALSMDREGLLTDSFFHYLPEKWDGNLLPLPGDSLRPWNYVREYRNYLGGFPGTDMSASSFLAFLSTDSAATPRLHDFELMSYLVDRNLESFTRKLLVYYPPVDTLSHIYTKSDSLPCHFNEAVCQYGLTAEKALLSLNDSIMTADYLKFDSLRVSDDRSAEMDSCRAAYKGTYWYYYFYLRR